MIGLKKISISGYIADTLNYIFMIALCIATIYPFLYLLSKSLSAPEVPMTQVYIIPPKMDLSSYMKVLDSVYIRSGLYYTVLRTVIGTVISLIALVCTAYPLSKRYFPHRNFWTGFIVFTMFFQGGLIPSYLLIRNLHLLDSIWSLMLPGLIPAFTLIIVRNYFMTLPESLSESAMIDGANDITILFRIILQISKPIIATAVLWIAVDHWNAWFDSMIYIQDAKKQVLQVILRRIVLEGQQDMMQLNTNTSDKNQVNPENVKAATIMFSSIPILLLYPFIQKYFVKGIMIGSLKG